MRKQAFSYIFQEFKRNQPHPKTELDFVNHYTLLVAVILSAQATDMGVNKATKALFAKIKTPQAMVKLGEEGLKKYIKTIGLFNAKAKNVIAMSHALIEKFGGEVPRTREELESLAGVGRKTANVVLNCAFGEPTMAVDTHVFRVANRLGLAKAKTPLDTELQLLKNIPKEYMQHAHHWLILHGRYVCVARKPKCGECRVREWCAFQEKSDEG